MARRHGISPTTVQKWRRRRTTADAAMGPKQARSPVLTLEQEAAIVAFRRHTLLPLDDCLDALQPVGRAASNPGPDAFQSAPLPTAAWHLPTGRAAS